MHYAFDRWMDREHPECPFERYADDFVVLCSSRQQAEEAQRRATAILGDLGLALHPDKTGVVDLRQGKRGFDFLGAIFMPASRARCGRSTARSATTCTAGRLSDR